LLGQGHPSAAACPFVCTGLVSVFMSIKKMKFNDVQRQVRIMPIRQKRENNATAQSRK
jgi:hypothetical protein